jgi:hypothetical protein
VRFGVLHAALAIWACLGAGSGWTQRTAGEILVQGSLTAGLRHHDAKLVWERLQAGDELTLVREPHNPHDADAVRVDWNGHTLGYLPAQDNAAVARQLDRGNALRARIVNVGKYRNHRLKLQLEVYLPL